MVSYLNLRNMVHRPPSQVRTFSLLPKDLTFIFLFYGALLYECLVFIANSRILGCPSNT